MARPPAPVDDASRAAGPLTRLATSAVARTATWAGANVLLLVVWVLGTVVMIGAVAGAGEVYEGVQNNSDLAAFDQPVLDWALGVRTPRMTAAWAFFSDTGGPVLQPIITGAVVLLLSWLWRSWTPLVLTLLAEAGALLMTVLGKDLIGRARPPLTASIPPHEYSASFPSGHTLNATVIAGILAYLLLHWFRTRGVRVLVVLVALAYAVAMGFSRVYLGHHWLTDVICAWLLGLAWLAVVVMLHRVWLVARAKHGEQRWTAMLNPGRPTPPRGR